MSDIRGAESVQIIEGMTHEEYIASSGIGEGLYISRSVLFSIFKDGPEAAYARYIEKDPLYKKPENAGMFIGTMYESHLLDKPQVAPDNWVVKPEGMNLARKDGKVWKAEQEEEGNVIVKESDFAIFAVLKRMEKNLNQHALCREFKELAHDGHIRKSLVIRWRDEKTGLWCQVELDGDVIGERVYDIKTGFKHPDKFTSSAGEWGYFFQQAMYTDAYALAYGKLVPFMFIYNQTKPPFLCRGIRYLNHHPMVENARGWIAIALNIIANQLWFPEAENMEPIVPDTPPWLIFETDTDGKEFDL